MCLQQPVITEKGTSAPLPRYRIVNHEYVGTMPSDLPGMRDFAEVIEVLDPPEGRWGILIHISCGDKGSIYYEFRTVDQAIEWIDIVILYDHSLRKEPPDPQQIRDLDGFMRAVACGDAQPWFRNTETTDPHETELIRAPTFRARPSVKCGR